mgnify:CR=1 FL=1
MNFLAQYIMKGRMQAMSVASSLALLSLLMPPISIVSSATVALVTLRRGAYEGGLVLLTASIAAAVLGVVVLGNFQFAFGYALILWLPVWLLAVALREGRHLSLALEIAAGVGVLAVIGFYLFSEDPAIFWMSVLDVLMQPMLENVEVPIEQLKQTVIMISQYMTGIVAMGSVSGVLFGLLLARWWQANLYNPGGFSKEYLLLAMPPRFALSTLIVLAVALLADGLFAEMAWNIGIILFMLYSFIGMAIIHAVINNMSAKRFLLPSFYVLFFVVPHLVVPIAIIGLTDTWISLRKNIKPKTNI